MMLRRFASVFFFFTLPAASLLAAELASAPPLPSAPLGSGAWAFQVESGWAKLPAGMTIGATHGGVAVDKTGRIYVSTDGPNGIMVFAPSGEFIRSIAKEWPGIHGFFIREENGKEYIYGTRAGGHHALKLDLDGYPEWTILTPRESGFYSQPADAKKKPASFNPTAMTVGPDGRIYVADGYGASVIHVFSPERTYLKTIGTRGEGDGQFKTCHGIALDTRFSPARLLVADRENRRLVHLDLDGNWLGVTTKELRRPCSINIRGDYAVVAELEGRVIVVDKAGQVVAKLGDNPDQKQWAQYRLAPEFWRDGIFVAAHGATFDAEGNIFVQDWNFAGRFTKLRRSASATP